MKRTNNNFEIDTKLGLIDYITVTEEIAVEYFDESGKYQPHIGRLNAMRVFYNHCVKKSPYDDKLGRTITNAMDMTELLHDAEFIKNFERFAHDKAPALDFARAYFDAQRIVKDKKNSINRFFGITNDLFDKLAAQYGSILTDSNIEKLSEMANMVKNGSLDASAIVDAYAKSKLSKKSEALSDTDKPRILHRSK